MPTIDRIDERPTAKTIAVLVMPCKIRAFDIGTGRADVVALVQIGRFLRFILGALPAALVTE